jgi:hypothetical protein
VYFSAPTLPTASTAPGRVGVYRSADAGPEDFNQGEFALFTPGQWHHVLLEFNWSADPRMQIIRLEIDRTQVFGYFGTLMAPSTGDPYLNVGVLYQLKESAFDAYFDNLRCFD